MAPVFVGARWRFRKGPGRFQRVSRVPEYSGVTSKLGSGWFWKVPVRLLRWVFQKVLESSGAWLHGISRGIQRSVKLDRPAVGDATEAYSVFFARLQHVCFFV